MADAPDPHIATIAALEVELAALRADIQDFTYAVSHDLRAPLRHIVSYAQLVQEDAGPLLSVEVQEFLSTITDSARHMGVLMDGLAALSRVGALLLDVGPVDLHEVVQAARDDVVARSPVPAVEWQIASDLPMVQADAALLRQALVQVLGNALKFSAPRAQAVVAITAVLAENGQDVCLRVHDNGVGYNDAMQAQLFRVFGRLHTSKQFEGIGMGLVLTRKMLARFGASVSLQGALDAGCCVELRLPRA